MTQKQIIAEIKNVVSSHLGEADVMLFGSRAKGSSTDDSDYDVLIITIDNLLPDHLYEQFQMIT